MNAAAPRLAAGPLAESLKRNRALLNAKFADANRAGARIDGEAFLAHLVTLVDPIVRQVAEQFEEKIDATTTALYELSIELFAESLLGPGTREAAITETWRTMLPLIPRLIARDPRRVVANISNAIHQIGQNSGARPADWIRRMSAIGPVRDDLDSFFEIGKVAAWIAGCPQYRQSALQIARSQSSSVLASLFDFDEHAPLATMHSALDSMLKNPWLSPADAISGQANHGLRIVRRAGAFRGFAGSFLRPPSVALLGTQLAVTDGEGVWTLHADFFGCVFRRTKCQLGTPKKPGGPIKFSAAGSLHWNDATANFPELGDWKSAAFDGQTLAVTLPSSHHLFLVARA